MTRETSYYIHVRIWCLAVSRPTSLFLDPGLEELAAATRNGKFLAKLYGFVDWESFRAILEASLHTPATERKSIDTVAMFKIVLLGRVWNLSDAQLESDLKDRISFAMFVGVAPEAAPDEKTI